MRMKKQFKRWLNQKLNPMFFIGICAAMLIFTIGAHLAIHRIGVEADKRLEVLTASRNVR